MIVQRQSSGYLFKSVSLAPLPHNKGLDLRKDTILHLRLHSNDLPALIERGTNSENVQHARNIDEQRRLREVPPGANSEKVKGWNAGIATLSEFRG